MTALPRDVTLRSTDAGWTRELWEQLPDDGNRYEIIDGVLYVSTAPSAYHQWILQELLAELRQQLVLPGIGLGFVAPIGVFMPGAEPVQPDLLVVRSEARGIIRDRRIYGAPALIAEILSPSNIDTDLVVKYAAYARVGVPEYWVVRPSERDILVHNDPDPALGRYRQTARVAPEGELIARTLPCRARIAPFVSGAPDTTL